MATTPNLKLPIPDSDAVDWDTPLVACLEIIDAVRALSNLVVRPKDVNPATGEATSRVYTVGPAWFAYSSGATGSFTPTSTPTAPASAVTYVWLEPSGDRSSGSAFPTVTPYAPLAKVTTDANRITAIEDLRYPAWFLGERAVLRLEAEYRSTSGSPASDTFYVGCHATSGPVTITLPAHATVPGRSYCIAKRDASANAVTVTATSPDLIDGEASIVLSTQYARVWVLELGAVGETGWARIG